MKLSYARSLLVSEDEVSTINHMKHHCTHIPSGPLKENISNHTMVDSQPMHMPLTPDGNILERAPFPVLEESQLIFSDKSACQVLLDIHFNSNSLILRM